MSNCTSKLNKTDAAWKSLFEKYDIVNEVEKNGFTKLHLNKLMNIEKHG